MASYASSDQLKPARELAARVRYATDVAPQAPLAAPPPDVVLSSLARQGLRITDDVTPELSRALASCCERLLLERDALKAFVVGSPEIQAVHWPSTSDTCVVSFTSGLVDLLDAAEFTFVAGHEIGHFLLQHIRVPTPDFPSIDYFVQQRAEEVSADRLGLIGCGSIEAATRAMMKSISGLSSRHLRFDLRAFLHQIEGTESLATDLTKSHPSLVVRCRALLWFNQVAPSSDAAALGRADLARIDDRIGRDMTRLVDGVIEDIVRPARQALLIWSLAEKLTDKGVFGRQAQQIVGELVGETNLAKLKTFMGGRPSDEVRRDVSEKLSEARVQLRAIVPRRYEAIVGEIRLSVGRLSANGPET